MSSSARSWCAAARSAVCANRATAISMIMAFVFASCTQSPTGTNAPTIPSAPLVERRPDSSIPRGRSRTTSGEETGETRSSTARTDAVVAYEFASLMEGRFGEGWRRPVVKVLHMDFVSVGMTPEEQRSIREFYSIVTDPDLAKSGAPSAGDDDTITSLRHQLRGAGSSVALDIAPPTAWTSREDPDADGPRSDNGDGDDCDSWQSCAYRARNECQKYAKDEAAVISAAAVTTCVFVGVVGGTVTANPLVGVGSGLTCRLLTSAYLNYIKRLLEEECTTAKCGSYPHCI